MAEGLVVLLLVIVTIVYMVRRPEEPRPMSRRSRLLLGLFFVLVIGIAMSFFFVPSMMDFLDEILGPPQSGDAFGMGRMSLGLITIGLISTLSSLVIVLLVRFILMRKA